jgi:hypothetical protein
MMIQGPKLTLAACTAKLGMKWGAAAGAGGALLLGGTPWPYPIIAPGLLFYLLYLHHLFTEPNPEAIR